MFAENTRWEEAPRKLHQHKPQAYVTGNVYIKIIFLTWPTALRANSNPAWEFIGFIISCHSSFGYAFSTFWGMKANAAEWGLEKSVPRGKGASAVSDQGCGCKPRSPELSVHTLTLSCGENKPTSRWAGQNFCLLILGFDPRDALIWLMQVISLPTWNLLKGFSSRKGGREREGLTSLQHNHGPHFHWATTLLSLK